LPFEDPQLPLVSRRAEHEALVPPLEPAQLQLHGPLPLTLEAEPVLQRLVEGAAVRSAPFADPHWPLVATMAAEHEALLPPLLPAQLQAQGPVPVMLEAVPMVQRLVEGALVKVAPFADPHWPLVATMAAEHEALAPPLEPAQLQFHGPLPLTLEAEPALQRLVVGALVKVVPFADPQLPLTIRGSDPTPTQLPFAHANQLLGPIS